VSGGASFSVRPQAIVLHDQPQSDHAGAWLIAGTIEDRAYLGEYWEYVVRAANSDMTLRVSTPPDDVYPVQRAVWMTIDPSRIAPIPPPETERES
jgi:ABC-type Fe3+/spermidine/putrescine transport system ATPase subunit